MLCQVIMVLPIRAEQLPPPHQQLFPPVPAAGNGNCNAAAGYVDDLSKWLQFTEITDTG